MPGNYQPTASVCSLDLPFVEQESTQPRQQVVVRSEAESLPWQDLLPMLGRLLPLEFRVAPRSSQGSAGEIVLGGSGTRSPASGGSKVSSLTVPPPEALAAGGSTREIGVRFADDPEVPFPFRGRSLRTKVAVQPRSLALQAGEKLLAESDVGPVWSSSLEAGVKHFRSALALPPLPPDGKLFDLLNGERFLEVLPLLQWLRELSGSAQYAGPPLRACFIFDDPNLHWPRYGFVDYGKIAAQAAAENYHVAFATIPLDSWFTHQRTAALFRGNASRLSLAIHGNNHTRQELAQPYRAAGRAALLRLATERIERLERAAGLRVSRVMVPPHGACSEEILADLPGHGFEAACISHGSLHAHNRSKPWVRTLGFSPSEVVQGCPVLPRWGFSGNNANTILLAAFLRQPMILRGHHEDLKAGLALLDGPAQLINSLGDVRWSNLMDLSRMNYQWRTDGNVCRLKPLGRRLTFPIPKHLTRLTIENSGISRSATCQISGAGVFTVTARAGEVVALPEAFEGAISIEIATPTPTTVAEKIPFRPAVGAFARRLLTEARDRLRS